MKGGGREGRGEGRGERGGRGGRAGRWEGVRREQKERRDKPDQWIHLLVKYQLSLFLQYLPDYNIRERRKRMNRGEGKREVVHIRSHLHNPCKSWG